MKFNWNLLFRVTLIILGGYLIINGLAGNKASDQSIKPGNSTINESINAQQTISNAREEGLAVWVLFGTDT